MVQNQQTTDAGRVEVDSGAGPSAWSRRLVILLLAAVDFLLAGYMALYQWDAIESVWDPVFGPSQSHQVLDSSVSEAFRELLFIPDAALGALAYLGEVVLAMVGSRRRWQQRPWLVVVFAANALAVTLVGLALVVLQAIVVEAWCLLCLTTAALSLAMLVLAAPEARASIGVIRSR